MQEVIHQLADNPNIKFCFGGGKKRNDLRFSFRTQDNVLTWQAKSSFRSYNMVILM
jgi:hypothetical protein